VNRAFSAGDFTNPGGLPQARYDWCAFGAKHLEMERRNYADSKTARIKPRNAPGRVSGGNADDSLQRARMLERVRSVSQLGD